MLAGSKHGILDIDIDHDDRFVYLSIYSLASRLNPDVYISTETSPIPPPRLQARMARSQRLLSGGSSRSVLATKIVKILICTKRLSVERPHVLKWSYLLQKRLYLGFFNYGMLDLLVCFALDSAYKKIGLFKI
jgi:hypothetical protein